MTERPPTGDRLHCVQCGQLLRPVGLKTVKHLLRYPVARTLRPGRFFHCGNPDCDVVYLRAEGEDSDSWAEEFRRESIKERARPYASGSERLVCHCFGYTVGEIEGDARSANVIPSAIAAEVRAGTCACEVMNPKGG